MLSERMRSVGRTRNEAIRQLGEFCKAVAIWGYQHRSHSQKAKHHHKVLLDAKPVYVKSGGCVTKRIRDNAHRTDPSGLDKPTHTMAKDYTINVGIDTTDAVDAISKLKKSMQTNITDLHVDKITTGAIDAKSINVHNSAPKLKIEFDDANEAPCVYLDDVKIEATKVKVDWRTNTDRLNKSRFKVEYYEQDLLKTYGESNGID